MAVAIAASKDSAKEAAAAQEAKEAADALGLLEARVAADEAAQAEEEMAAVAAAITADELDQAAAGIGGGGMSTARMGPRIRLRMDTTPREGVKDVEPREEGGDSEARVARRAEVSGGCLRWVLRGGAGDEQGPAALAAGALVAVAGSGAMVVRGEEGSELSEEACRTLNLPWGSRWGVSPLPFSAPADESTVPTLPFTELDDDKEIIRDLFQTIDTDKDDTVSREELSAAIWRYQDHKELVAALEKLLSEVKGSSGQADSVSFDAFSKVFEQLPRIRGERTRWVRSLGTEGALARLLKKGNLFDGLSALRELEGDALELHIAEVSNAYHKMLPTILRSGLLKLKASAKEGSANSAVQAHINSKFVLDGAFVGHFATLDDFYRGPEALIGVPNPRILEGAEKEHCLRANATKKFKTSNYCIETCPALEWEFVVSPKVCSLLNCLCFLCMCSLFCEAHLSLQAGVDYPHTPRDKSQWKGGHGWIGECGRDVMAVDELLKLPEVDVEVRKAGLLRGEVICLRLYTGPCSASSAIIICTLCTCISYPVLLHACSTY